MSTYVTVPEEEGSDGLRVAATERLGGDEGLKLVSSHLVNGKLCGTFTRDWETPDERVTHTDGDE
jgi:hypothetical protein